MAKKKYDPDDPDTWSDAQVNKYIIDKIHDIGVNLPWDKVVLSLIFIYGHWKAYGQGPLPTKGDVMLGILYALTIPPALQGGVMANGYALGALGALGLGLILPPDPKEEVKKVVEGSIGQFLEIGTDNSQNFADIIGGTLKKISDLESKIPNPLSP